MNFSGILIGVLTFFLIGLFHPIVYICGVLLWKPLLAGIFAGGHFVYDSIRKNAGNTLVGFPGCFGRQLLLEH